MSKIRLCESGILVTLGRKAQSRVRRGIFERFIPKYLTTFVSIIVASACGVSLSPLNVSTEDSIFPSKKHFLEDPSFVRLKNYRVVHDAKNLGQAGTAYEIWGDQPFLANTEVTLRYRYHTSAIQDSEMPKFYPVAIALDLRYPLDPFRNRMAHTFLKILENYWKIPLTQVETLIGRSYDLQHMSVETIQFPTLVAEVELKEVPQRGWLVSISFNEKAFHQGVDLSGSN